MSEGSHATHSNERWTFGQHPSTDAGPLLLYDDFGDPLAIFPLQHSLYTPRLVGAGRRLSCQHWAETRADAGVLHRCE